MSDIREPNTLGRARLEEKLLEMQLSLQRTKRRRLELKYELQKLDENEAATMKVIVEIQEQIKVLPEEG